MSIDKGVPETVAGVAERPADKTVETVRNAEKLTLTGYLVPPAEIASFLEEIHFCQSTAGMSSLVYLDFLRGQAGEYEESYGLRPVGIDVKQQLAAIMDPETRDVVGQAIAISMGGTNVTAGCGRISLTNGINLSGCVKNPLRPVDMAAEAVLNFEDANSFWVGVIPPETIEWMRAAGDNVPQIAFVPGFPVEILDDGDGYVFHFAQKLKCDVLGPFGEGDECDDDSMARMTIKESLITYLNSQGISLSKEKISLVPNDTFATGFANAHAFNPDKNQGAIIDGTGFNIGVLNRSDNSSNTECGHYKRINPSDLDKEVCQKREVPITPNLETLVSGKVMGDAFKLALEKLKNRNSRLSNLYTKIQGLSNNDATQLIFTLSYGGEMPAEVELDGLERNTLEYLANHFTTRAADYLATMIVGMGIEETDLFIEGSLLTKNLEFMADVNARIYAKNPSSTVQLVHATPRVYSEGEVDIVNVDSSLAGGLYFALADVIVQQAV